MDGSNEVHRGNEGSRNEMDSVGSCSRLHTDFSVIRLSSHGGHAFSQCWSPSFLPDGVVGDTEGVMPIGFSWSSLPLSCKG